jgi:hypothetical protein
VDSLEVTVTVDKPRSSDGIAIIGSPPQTIGINLKRAGKLSETMNVNLKNGKYNYTFDNVNEDIECIIEPRSFIVFEIGLGVGPYKLLSHPSSINVPNYQNGYKRGREHRRGEVRDYRLVIELYPMSPSNRDKFLMGFQAAYIEANDSLQSEKYVNIMKQSLSGEVYEQAFETAKKHVNNQVTDAFIQTAINRSIGLGGFELGWKAGYIEGFVQEMSKKRASDKEALYIEAETKYDALRKSLGS